MVRLNESLIGFECIRCTTRYPKGDYPVGCPKCHFSGFPASLQAVYDAGGHARGLSGQRGMARFGACLPFSEFPSLGEGDTPLVALPMLASQLGLADLSLKCEFAGPTRSHKDRMSCLAVARAVSIGADTVVAASSGNAGVSLAAYAAFAGLRCVIVTTPSINAFWLHAIEATGAEVIFTQDSMDRWHYVAEKVRTAGWFPVTNFSFPAVGSNCWGVDGYKTIAFELVEQAAGEPFDFIVVPSARGDLLWGIFHGMRCLRDDGRLKRIPRLVAVEPFPRLAVVLAGADYRAQFSGRTALVSIAGSTITWQAVRALQDSNGIPVCVASAAARDDQVAFARSGLSLELSAAATLSALRILRSRDDVPAGARIAIIGTASGFHETVGGVPVDLRESGQSTALAAN